MKSAFAWIAGVLIALLGCFIVIEGALPPKSFPIIVAGLAVVLLGGYVMPNTAVADGSKRLLIVAQPYIPAGFGGGRRADDVKITPKDGAP